MPGNLPSVPLNIKDAETDRLARELARETGETITDATRTAIQERLARVRTRRRPPPSRAISAIIERGRERALIDPREPDEIIGYDEHGLPQ